MALTRIAIGGPGRAYVFPGGSASLRGPIGPFTRVGIGGPSIRFNVISRAGPEVFRLESTGMKGTSWRTLPRRVGRIT